MKPGRNDPCPCGSGKKFKHCCGRVTGEPARAPAPGALSAAEISELVAQVSRNRLQEAELRALTLLGTVVLLAALAVDSAGGMRILFILLAVLLIACFPVGYVLGRSLHIQHSK